MKIYIVRHGERGIGVSNDILTEKGLQQTKKTSEFFKDKKIDKIFSSSYNRAKQTAIEIQKTIGCEIEFTELLNEPSLGIFESKPVKEWKEAFKESGQTIEQYRPPSGENRYDAYTRAKQFIKKIKSENSEEIIIVSHGGLISDLISLLHQEPIEASNKYKTNFCSITTIQLNEDKNIEHADINNKTHLENY